MSTHKHIDRIALLIILTVLAGVLILFAGSQWRTDWDGKRI